MARGFKVSYSGGYAWLTVYPPEAGGKAVYADDIINRMKMLKIPTVREIQVRKILREALGEPVRLVPWPEGEKLSARPIIEIKEEGMEAWLTVYPPKTGGEDITSVLIRRALEEENVKKGVKENVLRDIAERLTYNRSFLIAEGLAPRHGRASVVKYHFETKRIPYKELLYGRIDLKELNYIQNRKEGDILAEMLPPKEAIDGYTVRGEILEASKAGPGEELKAGENTKKEENRIIAGWDGNARLEKGAVIIEPVVTLNKVDYETGNIDFDGSVIVKGTVADGFTVKARGDIEAEKCVGRVVLEAGRNLILKQGINGDNEARVSAGGQIAAKYMESCQVSCGGDLVVKEALMHTTALVKGNLILSGGRAELLGGTSVVYGSLWCRKLGGLYEPPTSVIIGLNPDELEQYRALLTNLEEKRARLDELDRKIGLIKTSDTSPENRDKLQQAESQMTGEVESLSGEIQDMVKKSHDLRRDSKSRPESILAAEDRIYSGVHISFGFLDYTGNSGGKGVPKTVLRRIDDKIVEKGFNPSEPPEISPVEGPL